MIVLLLLATAGVIGFAKLAPDVSGFFSKQIASLLPAQDKNSSRIQIYAELDFQGLDLKSAEYAHIEFTNQKELISVNSEKVDLSKLESGSLDLKNFEGSLAIADVIRANGKAKAIFVNNISITPQIENLNLDGTIKFNSASFDLVLAHFSYTSSGSLQLNNGQVRVSLADEKIDLDNFAGIFAIQQGKLVISGLADGIKVAGKEVQVNVS